MIDTVETGAIRFEPSLSMKRFPRGEPTQGPLRVATLAQISTTLVEVARGRIAKLDPSEKWGRGALRQRPYLTQSLLFCQ